MNKFTTGIVAVVITMGLFCIGLGVVLVSVVSSPSSPGSPGGLFSAPTVTLGQIIEEYCANEVACERKYNGSLIQITGPVCGFRAGKDATMNVTKDSESTS